MANRAKNISSATGNKIRELRNKIGLTQKELADKLHKSESAIRMWELSKSEPDLQSINELAEIFGVSVDHILGKPIEDNADLIEDKLKIALFGNDIKVTEEMWQELLKFADFLKDKKRGEK